MDLGGTGQDQDFRPMTLTMTCQDHGRKWRQNKVGSGGQQEQSLVHMSMDVDSTIQYEDY